jgi:hypothetical protein
LKEYPRSNTEYIVSLPERFFRATVVIIAGLIYEASLILLPSWFRDTRIYRATVAGALRIAIELVGDLHGVIPPDDITAKELAVRKAAGTGIELAGIFMVGWSPLWLFAITADLTSGTRTYLKALVSELKRDEMLPDDADVSSFDELLESLEQSSDQVAETLDIPPLNVDDLRSTWKKLAQHKNELPKADTIADIYSELLKITRKEDQDLRAVSTLIATGAARAGVQMGHIHIFDYYQKAIQTIKQEGLEFYTVRVSQPYRSAAGAFFDPRRISYTERLFHRQRSDTNSKGN